MPASSTAISFLRFFASFLLLGGFHPAVLAQSILDEVHVTPRTAATANPAARAGLLASSGLGLLRKDVSLVLVPVSVTDGMERLVVGLRPDNFQVFEGKKPQQIRHFSTEDAPVSVGIIVDTSGSMGDKIDRVRDAVHKFCEDANPQDEFFMVTFSDKPVLASDFTNRPEDLEEKLVFTQAKGRTALLDAIYLGVEHMRQAKYAKKALLIISDGGDNHSRYGPNDVKAVVKESDVMIYAIGTYDQYVPTREEELGPYLLQAITEPTGGRAFTLVGLNELPQVAHRIGTELRTQYVIGYRPVQAPHDGKWHKISVKLMLPSKLHFLKVHAKKGYYAADSKHADLSKHADNRE